MADWLVANVVPGEISFRDLAENSRSRGRTRYTEKYLRALRDVARAWPPQPKEEN